MTKASRLGIDLIRELRLRQWARTHYVPAADRPSSWHPIVLDEMRCKDEEQAEALAAIAPAEMPSPEPFVVGRIPSLFVPLPPGTIYRLDAPHAAIPAPKLLREHVPSIDYVLD